MEKQRQSMLAELIYDMPLFTEDSTPSLEALAKELHVKEGFEETQEGLAGKIVALIAAAPEMYQKLKQYAEIMPDKEALDILDKAEGRV